MVYHMLVTDPSTGPRVHDRLQRITIQLDSVGHHWYAGSILHGLDPWLDHLVGRIATELYPTIQSWLSLSRVSSAPTLCVEDAVVGLHDCCATLAK